MRPCQCQLPAAINGAGPAPLLRRRSAVRCTAFSRHRGQPNQQSQRPALCPCRSSSGEEPSTSSDSTIQEKSRPKIASTLAGLDALLGIEEEKKDTEEHKSSEVIACYVQAALCRTMEASFCSNSNT